MPPAGAPAESAAGAVAAACGCCEEGAKSSSDPAEEPLVIEYYLAHTLGVQHLLHAYKHDT